MYNFHIPSHLHHLLDRLKPGYTHTHCQQQQYGMQPPSAQLHHQQQQYAPVDPAEPGGERYATFMGQPDMASAAGRAPCMPCHPGPRHISDNINQNPNRMWSMPNMGMAEERRAHDQRIDSNMCNRRMPRLPMLSPSQLGYPSYDMQGPAQYMVPSPNNIRADDWVGLPDTFPQKLDWPQPQFDSNICMQQPSQYAHQFSETPQTRFSEDAVPASARGKDVCLRGSAPCDNQMYGAFGAFLHSDMTRKRWIPHTSTIRLL